MKIDERSAENVPTEGSDAGLIVVDRSPEGDWVVNGSEPIGSLLEHAIGHYVLGNSRSLGLRIDLRFLDASRR